MNLLRGFTCVLLTLLLGISCSRPTGAPAAAATDDPELATRGTVEVTARLVEVPEGAIFKRDLYNYTTILKYDITQVHRGQLKVGQTIFVGHYNPFLPRSQAADQRVTGIGGNLQDFQPGQLQRMALDFPIDDHFMGGIVNKYFGQSTEPIYWAVWTNLAE